MIISGTQTLSGVFYRKVALLPPALLT